MHLLYTLTIYFLLSGFSKMCFLILNNQNINLRGKTGIFDSSYKYLSNL